MLLIYSRLPTTEKAPKIPELIREQHLSYSDILKEICIAISEGYEITYFQEGEFTHVVVFLKYGPGDTHILILTIRGTKEEVDNLQQEPSVKRYFNP